MAFALRRVRLGRSLRFITTSTEQKNDVTVLGLLNSENKKGTATIRGWVEKITKTKKYIFCRVTDGSHPSTIQIVVSASQVPGRLSAGAAVIASGPIGSDKKGNKEIQAQTFKVIGDCDVMDGYPFTPRQNHGFDYARQYLHLRPKLPFFLSILRVRQSTTMAVHEYFAKNNFIGIHTPILTGNDCEGAGDTFTVTPTNDSTDQKDYFGNKAYLTVSGQFHLEAIARSIPRVYTMNPVFRAENSKSRLHLSEFYMVEAEEGFIHDLTDIMRTMESLVKYLIMNLIKCRTDINVLLNLCQNNKKDHWDYLDRVLNEPFKVMRYSEAKRLASENIGKVMDSNSIQEGLNKEEELFLVSYNNDIPVFVIDWPKNLKPFYMKSCSEDENLVQAVDLLVPVVGELCGGGIREDDYETLKNKLETGSMKNLEWYLELRKFGSLPTGGFGMGLERFLQFGMKMRNIKDTIPFPRWPHSIQM